MMKATEKATPKRLPVFPYSDEDLRRIARESEERRAREPHAEDVRYDPATGLLHIALRGGATVATPARELRGLNDATDGNLSDVRVVDGRALFWDSLDVQMTLIAVLSLALGLSTVQSMGQAGGAKKSAAKAAAARVNGKKGGRPRTIVA
ncbi:MAG TPA: DUF2442 domain-containing protein [Abditibacteriaceae bacterium]